MWPANIPSQLHSGSQGLGRREWPVAPGGLRSRGSGNARNLQGCCPAAAPAGGSPRSRPDGLLRTERCRRAMESCIPEPAGICRGLQRSTEVVVPDGSLPYVRVRIDRRVGAVRAGAARASGGRECADLLRPAGDGGGVGPLRGRGRMRCGGAALILTDALNRGAPHPLRPAGEPLGTGDSVADYAERRCHGTGRLPALLTRGSQADAENQLRGLPVPA